MATDGQLARIEHDLAQVATAVRALESLETPMQSTIVREFRAIQAEVRDIQERGALATRHELDRIRDRLNNLEADVAKWETKLDAKADASMVNRLLEDRRTLTRGVLLAIVAAFLALIAQLIGRAIG